MLKKQRDRIIELSKEDRLIIHQNEINNRYFDHYQKPPFFTDNEAILKQRLTLIHKDIRNYRNK